MSHWLAQQIADSLLSNGFFPCHKTTTAGGADPGRQTWCVGALITMANDDIAYNNQAVRMACRLGLAEDPYSKGLTNQSEKCYESLEQWLDSHD